MKKAGSFKESFGYALAGFRVCFCERNFRIHLICGLLAMLLGVLLGLSPGEFAVILLLIGAILFAEMLNTALESLVDLVTEEYHPLAERVKDIAAGAVLVLCFFAILIGIVLFVPHILLLFF